MGLQKELIPITKSILELNISEPIMQIIIQHMDEWFQKVIIGDECAWFSHTKPLCFSVRRNVIKKTEWAVSCYWIFNRP